MQTTESTNETYDSMAVACECVGTVFWSPFILQWVWVIKYNYLCVSLFLPPLAAHFFVLFSASRWCCSKTKIRFCRLSHSAIRSNMCGPKRTQFIHVWVMHACMCVCVCVVHAFNWCSKLDLVSLLIIPLCSPIRLYLIVSSSCFHFVRMFLILCSQHNTHTYACMNAGTRTHGRMYWKRSLKMHMRPVVCVLMIALLIFYSVSGRSRKKSTRSDSTMLLKF